MPKKSTTTKSGTAKAAAKPSASARGGKRPKTSAQGPSAYANSGHPIQYHIQGSVKFAHGAPLIGITVRAFDWDVGGENLLGTAITNKSGDYEITFILDQYHRSKNEVAGPDLIVRAYSPEGQVVISSPRKMNSGPKETIDLVLDKGQSSIPYVVHGQVRDADGRALEGLTVRAYDRDLRSEELLGEKTTDAQGRYEIAYKPEQFRRAEKENADLIIRVVDLKGGEIGASAIVFNAPPQATIDVVTGGGSYRGPSEFDELLAAITPLLDGVALAELREDDKHQDITFLVRETGQDAQRITFFSTAYRLMRRTNLAAEVFYGLFRQGLPTELPALLMQRPEVLGNALVKASDANIIASRFGREVESILARFKDLIVQEALHPSAGEGNGGSSLSDLLGVSLEEPALRAEFVRAYVNHTGPVEDLWKALQARPEFKDRVADLQFTLQAGAVTASHVPLVVELQRMRQQKKIEALVDLTRFDEKGWLEIIDRPGPNGPIGVPPSVTGQDANQKKRNYAKAMTHLVEDSFPTPFIAQRLQADPLLGKSDLATFFSANPNFNIKSARLDTYLRENPRALDGVKDTEDAKARIKGFQRVYKLAPRYDHAAALFKDGFNSAMRIARMDSEVLRSSYAAIVNVADVARIRESALETHAIAQNLLLEYAVASSKVSMHAASDEAVLEVDGIPEWSTLFGSIELCTCENCRSVYSPAAYLVDILHFLNDRQSKIAGATVKGILFTRRPDLGEIELTCENTNNPLPYVDLVTEVLEDAVKPLEAFEAFVLPVEREVALNSRDVLALRDAFAPPLSLDAVITVASAGKPWPLAEPTWTIDEPSFTYTLRKENGVIRVLTRGRQTKGTAAERAAEPQYLNLGAYEVLAGAVYPWTLPFNFFWEDARAYLGHYGVSRWQIMESFRHGERAAALADWATANEYLGFTTGEANLINGRTASQTGADSPGPWNLWGFKTANLGAESSIPDPADSTRRIAAGEWLRVLSGRVDVFLQQAGLTYKEMLSLLDTYYVNPLSDDTSANRARSIRIVAHRSAPPDTCETAKLRLAGPLGEENSVNAEAASRIVRFVRVWRKLGWSMRDLDRAFTTFTPGSEPEHLDAFLVKLSHVQRLHEQLNIPVLRLLAWWGTLDHVRYSRGQHLPMHGLYTDHELPGQPRAASLYEQLFRNRAVLNPPDKAFIEDAESLGNADEKLSGHVAAITAAFQISATDVALLLQSNHIFPEAAPPETEPLLTFENLSRLHRHAGLARALRLSAREYLIALDFIATDPFLAPIDTLIFVETVAKAQASGFSFTELDYLLRHRTVPEAAIAPAQEVIGIFLSNLRAGLQKIALENTFRRDAGDPSGMTVDLDGALTRQKLALLNWDSAVIEQVIATLNGTVVNEAPLNELPPGLALPNGSETEDSLRGKISYDGERRVLRFAGAMTIARKARLDEVSVDSSYLAAVQALYDAPRQFVARYMRAFAVHDLSVNLEALPENLKFPPALKGKIYFDTATEPTRLHFTGAMSERERDLLLGFVFAFNIDIVAELDAAATVVPESLRSVFEQQRIELGAEAVFSIDTLNSEWRIVDTNIAYLIVNHGQTLKTYRIVNPDDLNHSAYRAAINDLYSQAEDPARVPVDFLTAGVDTAALFDAPVVPGDRFLRVLEKLLPYLKRTLGERLAAQSTADALQLEARSASLLLTQLIAPTVPADPLQHCLDALLDPVFAASSTNIKPTPRAFPVQFKAFLRIHKAAWLVSKFKLTHRQLGWLFAYGPSVGWLNLSLLPIDAVPSSGDLSAFLRVADLMRLREALPRGEAALDELFVHAHSVTGASSDAEQDVAKRAWFDALVRWSKWNEAELATLVGVATDHTAHGSLNVAFPSDYTDERLLLRLVDCFALLKRLGMSAELLNELAEDNVTSNGSRRMRQSVRAKYDEAQWLTIAKSLRDVLREKQRAALVAYLVAHLDLPYAQLESPHPLLRVPTATRPPAVSVFKRWLNAAGASPSLRVDEVFDDALRHAVRAFQLAHDLPITLILNNTGDVDGATRAMLEFQRPAIRELKKKLNLAGATPALKIDEVFDWLTHNAVSMFQNTHGLPATGRVDQATWVELDKIRYSLRDANDLYAHYLIDVEMQPCMMTSRIKQAIGSVQLFVQRCLMSLEPHVATSAETDKWRQWRWMKAYRVWEANRKVFLYPENWIEPELRDDKSPFFRELESELLQSDLTLQTAEQAFIQYLQKLDQVARLEIVGIHHQLERNGVGQISVDILHVFGRTFGVPHVYYYRQRVNDAHWTAWERVDLDIEGNHLIPVIWNRRLYLLWPIFMEKARPLEPRFDGDSLGGVRPQLYWEIKLAWSERKEGKWTNKRVSPNSIDVVHGLRRNFVFRSQISNSNTLVIAGINLGIVVTPPEHIQMRSGGLFAFDGCHSEPIAMDASPEQERDLVSLLSGVRLSRTHYFHMYLREDEFGRDENALFLPFSLSYFAALNQTPGTFLILPSADGSQISRNPFFYQDNRRTFFVLPSVVKRQNAPPPSPSAQWWLWPFPEERYLFQTFYHPYLCALISELNREGVDGLLKRSMQTEPHMFMPAAPSPPAPSSLNFKAEYDPQPIVSLPYPTEDMDFNGGGAYALYNWELFFHAPLLIADRLMKNQRYEEAQKWFHYIFDPTDTSSLPVPQRYWRTKPFYERTRADYQRQHVQYLLNLLAVGTDPEREVALTMDQKQDLKEFRDAIAAWRADPFKPHLVARMRTTAYQKTVVMKYIENLIGWGDQLFRRDTIESVNEATQLYVLAAEILGRRPEEVPPRATPRIHTYNSLESSLDGLSNALVEIEQFISPSAPTRIAAGEAPLLTLPAMLYFCTPKNDKLLGYWDTVADRLFKVRHCMNIEGVVRQLPLFEPPIDPALLVRATAAGVDIGSVLNDINVALPHYRFNLLAQKATELCSEVKAFGSAMLSALEKHDAERLTLLRTEHETVLLALVEQVRKQQYDESELNLTALRASRHVTVGRYLHYQKLLGVQSPQVPAEGQSISEVSPSPHAAIQEEQGFKMIQHEKGELGALQTAHDYQLTASGFDMGASVAHALPQFHIQPWGVGTSYGSTNIGAALSAFGSFFRTVAAENSHQAVRASRYGQFALRAHDWTLQNNQTAREIMQIDKQIAAAELRTQIAQNELTNHRKQLKNAREVEEFMRGKFTNQELYGWQIGQLAGVYFQSYQLAYDVAKRAERAFRYELGLRESSFIQFGYWDGLKKGLLAGEKLHHDLKRMDVAYLDQHRREYEISKHVSLSQLDPLALMQLRQTGSCQVSLPEALFDLDCPGHYLRRIKTASLSIPCVTGPYTGVNCTLTLLKSSVRHLSVVTRSYARDLENDDPRFTDNFGTIQSIVTSSAQNDSGLFEPNLRDERYLPFEGAGVISEWQIELPNDFRSFDYDTISDVVLHLRYTARDGGALLKQQAATELRESVNAFVGTEGQRGLARFFSLRHEFPSDWHRFLNPSDTDAGFNTLTVALTAERFPFLFPGIVIEEMEVLVKIKPAFAETYDESTVQLTLAPGSTAPTPSDLREGDLIPFAAWNGLLKGAKGDFASPPGDWTMNAWLSGNGRFDPNAVDNIVLLCRYRIT